MPSSSETIKHKAPKIIVTHVGIATQFTASEHLPGH
jgi:hypothetical protein